MWFRFPAGTDQISIEQQSFMVEHEDKDGVKYFRAPDHFAPVILGLSGFTRVDQPEGAPKDLEPIDPKRAEATDKLAAEVASLQEENQLLRQQLGEARRNHDELRTRHDDLQAELVGIKNNQADLKLDPGATTPSTAQPPIARENPNAGKTSSGSAQNQSSRR